MRPGDGSGFDGYVAGPRAPVAAGVPGFSCGSHWAPWLAANSPDPPGAVATCHASRATDVHGVPVQAHFAGRDPCVSASARRRIERTLPAGS